MDEVYRHLVIGWSGFLGILLRATCNSERMSLETLTKLKEAQATIDDVIKKQVLLAYMESMKQE
jgi:hypothetical protein